MSELFSTRKMLEVVEERRSAETFLRDTFFKNIKNFNTEFIQYDFKAGNRSLAEHVDPAIGGKAIQRQGFKSFSLKAPLLAPEVVTVAEDLLKRSAGEDCYNAASPMERAAKQLAEDLIDLDNRIARKEEYMCAQALLCGGIEIDGDGIHDQINFWDSPDLGGGTPDADDPYVALNVGQKWDATDVDPLANLTQWSRVIRQKSGINPSIIVMGSQALDAFLSNKKIGKYLDNRRIDFGNMEYNSPLPNGAQYYGKIAGLDVFSYDSYVEINGEDVPVFDPTKVLIGSDKVPTVMAYGACAVPDTKNETLTMVAAPRVPMSWVQRSPTARIVQIKSRPLPIIQQKNGFLVGKVL